MLIVPGRPAPHALNWWALAHDGAPPQLQILGPNAAAATIQTHPLARPGDNGAAGNAFLVRAQGLTEDAPYELRATHPASAPQHSHSRTLPEQLAPNASFTIALASCYCFARDPGVGRFYPPKLHEPPGGDPIRLRILCGDQIYMDLSPSTGYPILVNAPEPWSRYLEQWDAARYRTFLERSPNVCMADDHEFWNDYPHGNAWLRWDENGPGGPLGMAMDRAYEVFQTALNIDPAAAFPTTPAFHAAWRNGARTFQIDVPPLSLFFLDTRTARTRFDVDVPLMVPNAWIDRLRVWLRNPVQYKVLVLSQPAVEARSSWFQRLSHTMGDVNLPDYRAQFATLWEEIFASPRDVLVLSGDIHWSRAYEVRRMGHARAKVHEVISSPLVKIPLGSADRGDEQGKVEWPAPAGVAHWTRRYATTAEETYSTLTFTPFDQKLRVQARAWKVPSETGLGAELRRSTEFFLE